MQKLPDFVAAFSHHFKPLMRDGSQSTRMLFHPRINGRIALDRAVESQQFGSHRRFTLSFSRSVVTQHACLPSSKIARSGLVGLVERNVAPVKATVFYNPDRP
jgi:hypothetical protein